ncbi:MAG: glycosyltransferase family 39 protein [Myxococcota bacterium]
MRWEAINPHRSASRRAPLFAVLLIFAFGAAIRLLALEHNPPGLWQDEASTGADALALLHTGKDRAGAAWPVIAKSFGDYPLAGYRYLLMPVIAIFGLSVKTHRMVAAISGTLLLLVTAGFARRRFGDRVALFVLASGALTPTWIHYSRYGSEAILLPTCLTLALYFTERAEREEKPAWLFASATAFSAALYTYHAVKLILPPFGLALLWMYWPTLRRFYRERRRSVWGPLLLIALLAIPAARAALSPEGMARGNMLGVWNERGGRDALGLLWKNYNSYFEWRYLFMHGSNYAALNFPRLGTYVLVDAPFLLVGMFTVLRRLRQERAFPFLMLWFILGPIPGAFGGDQHNCGRAIAWLPMLPLFAALGFSELWTLVEGRRRLIRTLAGTTVAAFYLATAWVTWDRVMIKYPQLSETAWQFEISRALQVARAQAGNPKIVVSPSFYLVDAFCRFHLDGRQWVLEPRDLVRPGEVYAANASDPPPTGKVIAEIKDHYGTVRARVFGPK